MLLKFSSIRRGTEFGFILTIAVAVARDVTQVVECHPSKPKALSSKPSMTKKRKKAAGCSWLMPVILATQKTEIRTIVFKAILGK
jgi:hypothetical protein